MHRIFCMKKSRYTDRKTLRINNHDRVDKALELLKSWRDTVTRPRDGQISTSTTISRRSWPTGPMKYQPQVGALGNFTWTVAFV